MKGLATGLLAAMLAATPLAAKTTEEDVGRPPA